MKILGNNHFHNLLEIYTHVVLFMFIIKHTLLQC